MTNISVERRIYSFGGSTGGFALTLGSEGIEDEDPPSPIGYGAAREAEMLIFRVGVKGRADDGGMDRV
jgi:hypothetical protein